MPSRHLAEDRNAGDAHDAGLSARRIADHLGHSRPSLTQDVYLGRGTASPQAAAALQGSP